MLAKLQNYQRGLLLGYDKYLVREWLVIGEARIEFLSVNRRVLFIFEIY